MTIENEDQLEKLRTVGTSNRPCRRRAIGRSGTPWRRDGRWAPRTSSPRSRRRRSVAPGPAPAGGRANAPKWRRTESVPIFVRSPLQNKLMESDPI